jgi:hypothetical protein
MALQGHHLGQMDECCSAKGREIDELAWHGDQRRVLRLVLAISASMFVAEFAAGLIAGSAALVPIVWTCWAMPSSMFPVYLRLIEASDGGLATALAKGFTILAFGGIGVLAEIGVKIAERCHQRPCGCSSSAV